MYTLTAQTKNLQPFTAISTSGSVQVELVKGSSPKAEYTILKGDADDLVIEVKGDELKVKIKSNSSFWKSSQTKAKVTVYYQNLSSIDCSAGSSLTSESELTSNAMDIETSNGASCRVIIKADDVQIDASSGATLSISGSCGTVNYDASSGASIHGESLLATNAMADVSSGANIKLHADKKLRADASSGGSIRYKGNPEKTDVHSSVSGSIKSY